MAKYPDFVKSCGYDHVQGIGGPDRSIAVISTAFGRS